ncbi:MAG: hypothetical protein ACJ79K_13815 [Gemmatimonadaceae bacterium]
MIARRIRSATILALTVAVAACSHDVGPQRSVAAVAGIYSLSTVNGEELPVADPSAPISGMIYLFPAGHAERDITYHYNGNDDRRVQTGTFTVVDHTVALDLREQGSPYRWSVAGTIDNTMLTLSYPGPADGAIVERYRRQ